MDDDELTQTEICEEPHRDLPVGYCRLFVRARLAEALPDIVRKLITKAKEGSVPHVAMLLKTAGVDQKDELVEVASQRPEKSAAALLLEAWDRELEE